MKDEIISNQLLYIKDLLRDIEVSNVNNLKLILEKTDCIKEIIDTHLKYDERK